LLAIVLVVLIWRRHAASTKTKPAGSDTTSGPQSPGDVFFTHESDKPELQGDRPQNRMSDGTLSLNLKAELATNANRHELEYRTYSNNPWSGQAEVAG